MPIKGEKQRKLKAIKAGRSVRAPAKWWDKMRREIKKQYPTYGLKRRNTIIGGIWKKYSPSTKIEMIKKYQK